MPNTMLGLLLYYPFGKSLKIKDGCIEVVANGAGLWCLDKMEASAFTLGHVIYGDSEQMLRATAAHERVHVRQYEKWGPFFLPAYFFCSLVCWTCNIDYYWENPFEVQAYREETDQQRTTGSEDSSGVEDVP